MGAVLIALRIGHDRDVLVPVEADSSESAALLRALFADWVDDSVLAELEQVAPGFHVHLTSPDDGPGARTLPHLRYGSQVLARSRSIDPVLHALADVLGGVHERRAGDGRDWVHLRAFVRGDRATLADVRRPHLVNDRGLDASGIVEHGFWGVELEGHTVRVPPALPARWSDVGLAVPTSQGPALRLAGVVSLGTAMPAGQLVADLAGAGATRAWLAAVSTMVDDGRIALTPDRRSARAAIQALLG